MKSWSFILTVIVAASTVSFVLRENRKIKVFLVGDSTMSIKEPRYYPETGWGMPFVYFFDSTVTVDNRAKNGRSTKTFISEQLWQGVVEQLKDDDYVFIQFGHNDEVKEKIGSYTTPEEFKSNLHRYVAEARSKNAKPVLLTPVARRRFDQNGTVQPSHPLYSEFVREVAKMDKVPLIDLDKKSMELLQEAGPEVSRYFYLQLKPGEHPNYPQGKEDNTHFSEWGARKIAQIVLEEMKALRLDLANRVVKR